MSKPNRTKLYAIIAIAIVAIAAISGVAYYYVTTAQPVTPKLLNVAVLLYGTVGDYGYTYENHLAAVRLKALLNYTNVVEVENVMGPDAPVIMRQYAERGYDIVICTSWSFGDYIVDIAPLYPKVTWCWLSGVPNYKGMNATTYPNVAYLGGDSGELGFLLGLVAGKITKTNKIGYAAAMRIPSFVEVIEGFARGVNVTNPSAMVYVNWIGTFYDPPAEKEAARALLESGCDVVAHFTDSPSPGVAVQDWYARTGQQVYFISMHADTRMFAPDVYLTGLEWNFIAQYKAVVEMIHNGTLHSYVGASGEGNDFWFGLKEDAFRMTPYSSLVPKDVQDLVATYKQRIINGSYVVFPGMTVQQKRTLMTLGPNVVAP